LGYVYDFLKENNIELYKDLVKIGEESYGEIQGLLETHSIREILLSMNDDKKLKREHEIYLRFTQAAFDDFYIGIDWLANYWYRRNLIAFTNVKRLISEPNERILVIYGGGHKYLLDQFFNESNQFNVHSVNEYL
jgi:hypothetical protein